MLLRPSKWPTPPGYASRCNYTVSFTPYMCSILTGAVRNTARLFAMRETTACRSAQANMGRNAGGAPCACICSCVFDSSLHERTKGMEKQQGETEKGPRTAAGSRRKRKAGQARARRSKRRRQIASDPSLEPDLPLHNAYPPRDTRGPVL